MGDFIRTNIDTYGGGCGMLGGLIDGECVDNGGDGVVNFGT